MIIRPQPSSHINFTSYDRVEDLAQYPDEAALQAYRDERLARYRPQVAFLKALGIPAGGLRVVEIGSGSSAFLYALESGGLLAEGVGVDLSLSRHEFAERWRIEAGYRRVTNLHGDFAHMRLPSAAFDRFLIIDDSFLLLRPENEEYPRQLLSLAHRVLVPGGMFIAAFRNDARVVPSMIDKVGTSWVELPASNAFRYALYRREYIAASATMKTESIYLAKDGRETRKVEITDVCDVDGLTQLSSAVGFRNASMYGDFGLTPFDPATSTQAVVVVTR